MTDEGAGGAGLPPAGWYPDAATPARERLWTGERWIEWIRPVKVGRVEEVPAGWYPDTGRPGFERLWSGEMWTEEKRLAGAAGQSAGGPSAVGGMSAPPLRPLPTPPAVLHYDARPPERLRTLGFLTQVALAAVILAALAELITDGFYLGVLGDFISHRPTSVSHVESVVDAIHATRTIMLIAQLVTAIAFICWFYRAYRNLIRTGIHDVRYGTGWAIGGWFIPFFSLVRPKQVANDIWKGSASAETVGIARWREVPLSNTLNWWWAIWILGGFLFAGFIHAVGQASTDPYVYTTHELSAQRGGIWALEFGLAALIAAAVLAILLVGRISRLQDDNFKAVPAWDPGAASAGHPLAAAAPGSGPAAPGTALAQPQVETKICPDCAEEIKTAARVCRFCGYRFDQPPG